MNGRTGLYLNFSVLLIRAQNFPLQVRASIISKRVGIRQRYAFQGFIEIDTDTSKIIDWSCTTRVCLFP